MIRLLDAGGVIIVLQNANDPATAPTVPGHGSNIPREETKMNKTNDTTAAAETPETRSLAHQLIDIYDLVCNASDLATALDMATEDIIDTRQRHAMSALCDVLLGRFEDLKGAIEEARGGEA